MDETSALAPEAHTAVTRRRQSTKVARMKVAVAAKAAKAAALESASIDERRASCSTEDDDDDSSPTLEDNGDSDDDGVTLQDNESDDESDELPSLENNDCQMIDEEAGPTLEDNDGLDDDGPTLEVNEQMMAVVLNPSFPAPYRAHSAGLLLGLPSGPFGLKRSAQPEVIRSPPTSQVTAVQPEPSSSKRRYAKKRKPFAKARSASGGHAAITGSMMGTGASG